MIIRRITRHHDDEAEVFVSGHPDSTWDESQCVFVEARPFYTIALTANQAQELVDALTDAIATAKSAPHSSTAPQRYEAVRRGIDIARQEAAERNARMFGTDPSWYGQ